MKEIFLLRVVALLASLLFCTCVSAKPYSTLSQPVADAPDVVEFFSFYCGPCYLFIEQYPVVAEINRVLPEGTVTRYHVGAMGKYGSELSEAWAVATVTGVSDLIQLPLFRAVQRDRVINKPSDIYAVFREVGISPEMYESARHSMMVKAFIARQDEMVRAFQVSSTPSIYVKGRYYIENGGVKAETPEGYVAAYARLVSELMNI